MSLQMLVGFDFNDLSPFTHFCFVPIGVFKIRSVIPDIAWRRTSEALDEMIPDKVAEEVRSTLRSMVPDIVKDITRELGDNFIRTKGSKLAIE